MQVKLLRLLESGTYRRVGSTELRRADVRLVSATHRDLEAMVADGRFREDLYYRLSIFPILLPPLRGRREDIPLLVDSLLVRVAAKRRLTLAASAMARLQRHDFPGNVRELRNVLERAALLCDGNVISGAVVERALMVRPRPAASRSGPRGSRDMTEARSGKPPSSLKDAEIEALRAALITHQGSRQDLARSLGISLRTLYRKLGDLDASGS